MSVMFEAIKKPRKPFSSYELETEEVGEIKEVQMASPQYRVRRNAPWARHCRLLVVYRDRLSIWKRRDKTYLLGGDYAFAAGSLFSERGNLRNSSGRRQLGRVIDPLGNPQDGKIPCPQRVKRKIMYPAPQVIERSPVQRPL